MNGIIDQIKAQQAKLTYKGEITLESLTSFIKEVYEKAKDYVPNYVVMTGWMGKFMFDLQMRGLNGYELPKFYHHITKRTNQIVFSLYRKQGNIKIILSSKDGKNILDLRYGTNSLGLFSQFEQCTNHLKQMRLI